MKFFAKKAFLYFFIFSLFFTAYITAFPNDFFLSKSEFIDSPYFFYKKGFLQLTLYDKRRVTKNILEIISNPDKYLVKSNNLLKDNYKRTLTKVSIDSKNLIIKRFNNKNLYDWMTKCPFRSSKAYRSWYYAFELKKKGVETIEPIALIEKRVGPFWTQTYLITEYVEGETLHESLYDLEGSSYQNVSEKITQILDIFYKMRWLHRDFISQNILITKQGVAIIDLDEMHSYTFNNNFFKKKFFKKHLTKFLKSISQSSHFKEIFLVTHNNHSAYNSQAKALEPL